MPSECQYLTASELREFLNEDVYTVAAIPDADLESKGITPAERWANTKLIASRFGHRIPYAAGACPEELKEAIKFYAAYRIKRHSVPIAGDISEQTMEDRREAERLIADFIAGKGEMGATGERGEARIFSTIPDPGVDPT